LLDHVLRRDHIAGRLRHFSALAVEDKTVREHGVIRRAVVGRDTGQQGAMKPAAMLIRSFEVQGRGPPLSRFQHSRITHARFEPDVENIFFFFK
jgi:hypothetical protein